MTYLGEIKKDPQAILPYSVDWGLWLAHDDGLASSEWIITPAGSLLASNPTVDSTGRVTNVILSGGVAGTVYTVTNRIKTLDGVANNIGDDRSFKVVVEER